MMEFLQNALCNSSTFWKALEALSTLAAAVFAGFILFREIPKLRTDTAARKVDSLKYVLDFLKENDFMKRTKDIMAAWKDNGSGYPEYIHEEVVHMFRHLDYVGLFIELKY